MANFWFISAPLLSHTDWGGTLKTALALRRLGHDVTWVSESKIGGYLTSAGIDFAPVSHTGWLFPPPPVPDLSAMPPQEAVTLRYRRALDTWLTESLVGDATQAILDLAGARGTPDGIVTDPFLTASALAAEALGVPLAVSGWIAMSAIDDEFLYPVQRVLSRDSQERVERLCARFGLAGVNFSGGSTPSILSPHLHLSYFNEAWYAAEQDQLLPQTRFVGGFPTAPRAAPPSWLGDIPDGAPLALVTLGTIFTGDLGFFSWAAHAVARAGYVPVVVIGWNMTDPEDKAKLKAALPKTTRLLNWVDFDHVLPRTRLIVHHGGMGTTHAAAVHGIPQLCVPHAADQRGNARRVAQAKVGLNLSALDVRRGALLEGALALTRDARVRENARRLAADLASLGGPPRAAELLAGLVGEKPLRR